MSTMTVAPREGYRVEVLPHLTTNLYLDHTLRVKRGPDGVELEPEMGMTSGDGYLHFSIPTTLGEEAAWWAVGDDHAVPACVQVQLLRPAHVNMGTLVARGELIRAGKGIMVSEGTVMQGMKMIAKVSVTWTHFEKQDRRGQWQLK